MPTAPTSEGISERPSDSDLASQILVLIGHAPEGYAPTTGTTEAFRRATKKQLLDCAQRLGLTGVSKLTKDELAGRVDAAFAELRKSPDPVVPTNGGLDAPARNGGATLRAKFDLGPEAAVEEMPQDIPWGYGHDRVTAMVVNPNRLYVYWEVTDDALAAARDGLGAAGAKSWLNVRVYDITGRLFDGTNAHSYFDHAVERHDRQWFFDINKPTSATCVEVGVKSPEGYFVKIARSGRAEFPRSEPVGGGGAEWLSVRTATGDVGSPLASGAPPPPGGPGGPGADAGGAGGPGGGAPGGPGGVGAGAGESASDWDEWTHGGAFPTPGGQRVFGRRWEWQDGAVQWASELNKTEWVGPLMRTEWEAGPFVYPLEVPSTVELFDAGEISFRTEGGRVHITYGPWQVVIRGIGARAERRVLGTWEYRRQVAMTGGVEKVGTPTAQLAPGSSEWLLSGASERMWMGSSELIFAGASEMWLMGASEVMFRGSSEQLFQGASELRFRGASERRFAGATEVIMRGASERLLAGSSEQLLAGASERQFAGASEAMIGGASEVLMRGASERPAVAFRTDASSPYPVPPETSTPEGK